MATISERPHRDPDALLARVRAGDQEAWEELFHTCYPKVVRVVRRKLDRPMRSLYDSTDFASDVMTSLAAKFDKFDFPSLDSLMAFLKDAAERKVIDEYRRRHTLKRDVDREERIEAGGGFDSGPRLIASDEPTASKVAQAHETCDRIMAGLNDDTERKVIDLKRRNFSISDISGITGWHPRKVQRFFKDLLRTWQTAEARR